LGEAYDALFDGRLTADYIPVLGFTGEQAAKLVSEAKKFVGEMERLAR
jgi:uncharacterized protein (UPF0332 family)